MLSQPLNIDYVDPSPHPNLPDVPANARPDGSELDNNRKAINEAVTLANRMLDKMMLVVLKPTDSIHEHLISAAFGPSANIGKIKENVLAMRSATIRARDVLVDHMNEDHMR